MAQIYVANYIRILHLQGISSIKREEDLLIQESSVPEITIFLTKDLDGNLSHVCNSQGIGRMALAKFFHRKEKTVSAKELEEKINEVRREIKAKFPKGVYLVLHGRKEIKVSEFRQNELENSLTSTFDGRIKDLILEEFNSCFGSIILKVLLCIKENFSLNYTEVGDAAFLNLPKSSKNIYCLRFKAQGFAAAMGTLDENTSDFDRIGLDFVDDKYFEGVATLFLQSLNEKANNKEAFFNSWIALEKFISKVFETCFPEDWKEKVESAPKKIRDYFTSNDLLNRKRPNLVGKLGLILSNYYEEQLIDEKTLEKEFDMFDCMNKNRNKVFHSKGFVNEELLKFDEIQRFLKRHYLYFYQISSVPKGVTP